GGLRPGPEGCNVAQNGRTEEKPCSCWDPSLALEFVNRSQGLLAGRLSLPRIGRTQRVGTAGESRDSAPKTPATASTTMVEVDQSVGRLVVEGVPPAGCDLHWDRWPGLARGEGLGRAESEGHAGSTFVTGLHAARSHPRSVRALQGH